MYVSVTTSVICDEPLTNPLGIFVIVAQSAEPLPADNASTRASSAVILVPTPLILLSNDAESVGYVFSLKLLFATIEFF
jgi:hypothetical protein